MKNKTVPVVLWGCIAFLLSFRLYPAFILPPFGDEGSDLIILYRDYLAALNFFDAKMVIAAEQSRLSHLMGALLFGFIRIDNATMFENIGIIRMLFFIIHVFYIIVSYHFVKKLLKSRNAAYLYVFCLVTSCYIASYSTALMTTGESVYMLFQILSIWLFYSNFRFALENNGKFKQFSLLCLVISACIAGKLFGLLLLIAFMGVHLIHYPKLHTLKIKGPDPKYLSILAFGFFTVLIAINLGPISPHIKSITALALAVLYLTAWIMLAVFERKEKFDYKEINAVYFWILLIFSCFTLVLTISPIYLNLENFFDVFQWFGTWGPEKIKVESSKLDAIIILLVKFGLVPSVLLGIALTVSAKRLLCLSKQHLASFFKSIHFLLLLIVGLNLLLISLIHLKLPWHGISIFPFLFMPFAAVAANIKKLNRPILKFVIIAALMVIPLDNIYRYFYWYPYGHFDGGQYGQKYIGLNKPCLISFEVVPTFYDYFSNLNQKDNKNYQSINVKGANVTMLNNYLIQMLKGYFRYKGQNDVKIASKDLERDRSDLIVSSPIFTPNIENQLTARNFRKLKTLSVANITVANIWTKKPG